MDSRKWRVRKIDGTWLIFQPGRRFTPLVSATSAADALVIVSAIQKGIK